MPFTSLPGVWKVSSLWHSFLFDKCLPGHSWSGKQAQVPYLWSHHFKIVINNERLQPTFLSLHEKIKSVSERGQHRKDRNETKRWDPLGARDTSPGFDWHDVCWHLAVLYTNSTDGLNEVKHSTDLDSTWPCFPFQLNSTSKHKLKCCFSGLQREKRSGDRSERDLLGDWRSFSYRVWVEEFSQTKEEHLKPERLFVWAERDIMEWIRLQKTSFCQHKQTQLHPRRSRSIMVRGNVIGNYYVLYQWK